MLTIFRGPKPTEHVVSTHALTIAGGQGRRINHGQWATDKSEARQAGRRSMIEHLDQLGGEKIELYSGSTI